MQITIFSTSACPFCKMLKTFLDQNKINYTEKLVDQDDQAKQEMMKASGGFLGVPFIIVTQPDGSTQTIVGFDKAKLTSLLGL